MVFMQLLPLSQIRGDTVIDNKIETCSFTSGSLIWWKFIGQHSQLQFAEHVTKIRCYAFVQYSLITPEIFLGTFKNITTYE